MTDLYLSRIKLQEFRSFGELDVELPAKPGVLIVHGSNGLGKSSLFDGLEWALSTKVNHLPEQGANLHRHFLRRFNAPESRPTHIRLEFNDGWLMRGLDGKLDSDGQQDVEQFLRHASWKNSISDLDRYLLLTHFLGQSTKSRMTHRPKEERWKYLQEPAQSERAADLVRILHGHGNSTAARAFDKKAEQLAKEAEDLGKLLAQEEDYWREAQLEGAIDDRSAPAESEAIVAELRRVSQAVGIGFTIVPPASAAPDLLASLKRDVSDAMSAREGRLRKVRQLIEDEQAAELKRAELRGALTEARAQQSATTDLAAKAADAAEAARIDADRAEAALNRARAGVAALDRLVAARSAHIDTASKLEHARATAATIRNDVAEAAVAVERAEKRRRVTERLVMRDRKAGEEISQALRRQGDISAAQNAHSAREEARRQLDEQLALQPDVGGELARAAASLEVSQAREIQARTARDSVKTASDALVVAVGDVAVHVSDDSCECPLCGTTLPSGVLQRRIAEIADRLAPALVPLEAELSEALRSRDAAARHLANLEAEKAAIEAATQTYSERSTAFAQACAAAGIAGADSHAALSALRLLAQRDEMDAGFRRQRAQHWIRHPLIGGSDAALDEWTDASARHNELMRSLEALQRSEAESEGQFRTADRNLEAALADVAISPDATPEQLSAARQTLADEEVRAALATEGARSAHAAARAAVEARQENNAALAARVAELIRQDAEQTGNSEARRGEWTKLAPDAAPFDAAYVDAAATLLAGIEPELDRIDKRIETFRAGRIAWARQARHYKSLADLGAEAGAAATIDRETIRALSLTRQQAILARVQSVRRARDIARGATQEVESRVEAFNQQFLKPLGDLMIRLNRSILTDRHIGLDLLVGKNKIDQRTITGPDTPDHVAKLDPLYVHSEGQMAALAVSMLTAASLSYPWSRWRALVMDDPLQHNDAIHASAFADMMRNLVTERGYQIFLTTHELAEAQFLRRKFRAADIPCTTIHLTGRGELGVESRVEST